jgi:putative restriction endonuclease
MSGKIRYLTKQLLIEFNKASIREKRNRNIREDFLESLPEKYYPVEFVMYHNGMDEVRTMVIFDGSREFAFLDMSTSRYETIPTSAENTDGEFLVLDESEIRELLPYDGKEYTEKVYKKPYREQNFRKKVLAAYSNECAVCGVKNIKLLRAAHIKDAASGGNEETYNGICLCANHEISFDSGDLLITSIGEILSVVKDDTITISHISYPDDESDWPSKELLEWKYNKLSRN